MYTYYSSIIVGLNIDTTLLWGILEFEYQFSHSLQILIQRHTHTKHGDLNGFYNYVSIQIQR